MSDSVLPRWLLLLAVVYFVASLAHFGHNAEYIAFYPGLPDWLTREKVYLAWLGITGLGLIAWLFDRLAIPALALLFLAAYGAFGLDGLAHYTLAFCSEHTLMTNITIWFEALTGLVLLLASSVLLARRSRAGVLGSCLAALLQACSATGPGAGEDHARLVAQLSAQADAWDKAIVRKDRVAIEANMAEDFRQIGSSGEVETKASFLAGLVSADLQIDPYTVEDFDVRLYGDTALLSGRTRMTGRYQGKPFASHYRYIDIYVRRGGQWRIVSVQTTRMASPPAQPAQGQ